MSGIQRALLLYNCLKEMIILNTAEASLFLYSLQLLFDEKFDQKKVVFKLNDHYLTAKLYDLNPFEEKVNQIKFQESFNTYFLENNNNKEHKKRLQENLPATFIQIKKFVLKNKIKVSDLDIVLKNVDFLDTPQVSLPFLLIDTKDSLEAVSLLENRTMKRRLEKYRLNKVQFS